MFTVILFIILLKTKHFSCESINKLQHIQVVEKLQIKRNQILHSLTIWKNFKHMGPRGGARGQATALQALA